MKDLSNLSHMHLRTILEIVMRMYSDILTPTMQTTWMIIDRSPVTFLCLQEHHLAGTQWRNIQLHWVLWKQNTTLSVKLHRKASISACYSKNPVFVWIVPLWSRRTIKRVSLLLRIQVNTQKLNTLMWDDVSYVNGLNVKGNDIAEQLADIFTKALEVKQFQFLRNHLVRSRSSVLMWIIFVMNTLCSSTSSV